MHDQQIRIRAELEEEIKIKPKATYVAIKELHCCRS